MKHCVCSEEEGSEDIFIAPPKSAGLPRHKNGTVARSGRGEPDFPVTRIHGLNGVKSLQQQSSVPSKPEKREQDTKPRFVFFRFY